MSTPPFRWCHGTSNSAYVEKYNPCKSPNSSPQSNCTTAQPHALHLPAFHSKEPSVATWPLKPSAVIPSSCASQNIHCRRSACASMAILCPDHVFHTSMLLRSSHLFPRLNLSDPPHPSFFQLVTPFSPPNSFCPILSSHGGKLFFNFKDICLHGQGKRSCAFFACCRSHLSPQIQPLSVRHPNRMGSPSPCWHHACT